MDRINLHEAFIKALYEKKSKRSDLVSLISDVLRIERESASRRLSGKVQFSIQEMGSLAKELNISLDALLYTTDNYQWVPLMLQYPMTVKSIDTLCDMIDADFKRIDKITQRPTESGAVISTLPIELFIYHPYLMKFMFFKWGYYFIGTEEFDKFSNWKLPERLARIAKKYEASAGTITRSFYIWDESLIWALAKEIEKLHIAHAITTEERNILKQELKDLLKNLESFIKGIYKPHIQITEVDFYVSTPNLGFTCFYLASDTEFTISFEMNFVRSVFQENYERFVSFKTWMNSLQRTSNLLSKSGQIYRRSFFESQHNILDSILS